MTATRPDVLDTLDMWGATMGLADQVDAAARAADDIGDLPDRAGIENVLVLGMGGSGIAGDVMAAVAGPFMPVPVVVSKGYEPPSFVGDATLCFAVSCSGNTEETVEAAQTAAVAGARMVVVAQGGELEALARGWHAPFVRVPEMAMPRAAIGALSVPPLVVLERIGLFPGAGGWINMAVEQLRTRSAQLARESNPARDLARHIGRTLPIIWGGGEIGGVAALRWRNQVNENPKTPAFWGVVPELTHNEITGFGQHGDVTRQVFTLVLLRHDHEHPQVMRRFELVRDYMDEVVGGIEEVQAEGEGGLAQLFDLMLFGDVVSLELASQADVDPGPIPVLDDIKQRLRS